MSDLAQNPAPTTTPVPRRRRRLRTALWAGAAALVLLVAAVLVGTRLYAAAESDEAAAPLTPATEVAAASGAASDPALDGTWAVVPGGTAGYRVEEVLNGEDITVTGRTDQVTGSFTIDAGSLTAGEVAVDLASTTTDSDRRDEEFVQIVGADTHPTSTFTLTGPVALGGLEEAGASVAVTLPGTLSINGQTQQVAVEATATRTDADTITVTGAIPVTWSDYGVEAPDLGFVSVEDTGSLEFAVAADHS